jgi:hypothetical protein
MCNAGEQFHPTIQDIEDCHEGRTLNDTAIDLRVVYLTARLQRSESELNMIM